jgi:hypothetical protein
MSKPLFTNNAATALAVAITPTSTVLQVVAGTGQYFPNVGLGTDYFMLTLIQVNNPEVSEIVKCTSRTNDYLTVVRGQENTQPQIFNISDNVQLRITASSLNYFSGNKDTVVVLQEYHVATANQTIVNVTSFSYVLGSNCLSVYVNGSKQVVGLNYSETSSSSVTFVSGLNAGDIVEFTFIENTYG